MTAPAAKPLFRAISGQGATVKEPLPLPLMPEAPVHVRPRVEVRRGEDRAWRGGEPAFRFMNREDGQSLHQGVLL
ncbi:hypothetical protein [Paracoccus sp. TOH]|uniref:hypothetical protein n=1 Tax=Paracoccus sp. TOH TaxID=1263728 RepID=UPI0025B18434|nr:hypothetical protein [Paracoccus sp. TOH]WJS86719.1 hypothetical protein NBE95_19855 [Paracoccus sp. TOH]